jgi:hypothetical protein
MGTEAVSHKVIEGLSADTPWTGRYTTDSPSKGWERYEYNDSGWESGQAAFASPNEFNANTIWDVEEEIWVRREITVPADLSDGPVYLKYLHDDIVEIYVNGVELVKRNRPNRRDDIVVEIPAEVKAKAVDGKFVVAAHCRDTGGHAILDFGFYAPDDGERHFERTATQLYADVQATQTRYGFECGPVNLDLTFTAPLLMDDLDLLSRPVNYISYDVESKDGKAHNVEIYFEASAAWALDNPAQEHLSEGYAKDGLLLLKTGSTAQNILARKGDDIRIDWGYFYLAAE